MKKVKIDLDDLVLSFNFDGDGFSKEYLDTETGDIIHIPDEVMSAAEDEEDGEDLPDWEKDLIEDANAILEDEEDRYIPIPTIESHYFYNAMVDFTNTVVEDPKISEELENALNGRKPMRSFKDELHKYPSELDKWYEYEDKAAKEYVLDWLKDHEIEIAE